MKHLGFFRNFFNVTATATVEFALGFVEGVVETNFTTNKDKVNLFGAENVVQGKISKILSISAGGAGAIVKTTTVVAKTIAEALPTSYI